MAKTIVALALRDMPVLGVSAGQLLSADEAVMKPLQDDGSVDAHKDAVANARKAKAVVVELQAPPSAEALAAVADAQGRLFHLQGLLQCTRGEERQALEAQVQAAADALAKLQPAA